MIKSTERQAQLINGFQSLDNNSLRKSKRWKVLLLLFAALILSARGVFAELPAQEAQWPLMPTLVGHAQIEQAAGRLAGDNAISARNAERTLERMLRGRDEDGRLAAALVLAAHYRRSGRIPDAAALVEQYADLRPENLGRK